MTLPQAALALVIEACVGYPPTLLRTMGHPVIWIGRLITILDNRLNLASASFARRRLAGVLALILMLAASLAITVPLQIVAQRIPGGLLLAALLGSSALAQRSLYQHVAAVAAALDTGGLEAGRLAVSHIVGRDPESLDEEGVCRAAVESLAENFSDGVVAPAFWLAIAGLPGAAAYKAVNTADSMIGHRTPRHQAFGWAAARLDDVVNLPASRLSALLLAAAALVTPGARAGAALRAVWRDARRHRSPNAGWPEAAMAGALGLALAGPRRYGGTLVDDAVMGDGRRQATPADIRRALRLFVIADAALVGLIGLAALLIG